MVNLILLQMKVYCIVIQRTSHQLHSIKDFLKISIWSTILTITPSKSSTSSPEFSVTTIESLKPRLQYNLYNC